MNASTVYGWYCKSINHSVYIPKTTPKGILNCLILKIKEKHDQSISQNLFFRSLFSIKVGD